MLKELADTLQFYSCSFVKCRLELSYSDLITNEPGLQ